MSVDVPTTHSLPQVVDSARYGRRYWLLWVATAISMTGDGVALAAFPLLAERVAGASALMVSVVYAAGRVPYLFAVHAGALVDRSDRRRLVTVIETGRAVLLAAFAVYVAFLDHPSVVVIIGTVFLIGCGQVVVDTTSEVVLPELVPAGRLGRANGLLYSMQSASEQMAGPALGGVLFALAVALPFYFDGASFVAAALLLPLAIPPRPPQRATVESSSFREDVRAGLRYFSGDGLLKTLAAVILTFAFCQSMVLATLVVFSSDRLGLGPKGFGALIAITSVGNVLGSLVGGRIDAVVRSDVIIVVAGVIIAGSYAAAGATDNVFIVGGLLLVEAVLVAIGNVSSVTVRQRIIPPELLGRVMGTFRLLILGSIPIGSILGGLLAQSVRSWTPFLMAGGLQLLSVSVLAPLLIRRFADDPRLVADE